MHQKKHAADWFFALLKKAGINYIFGIPGDELEIFDALSHSEINFITTRHEQAAAFMAEAIGKTSSLPGVCISTLGPGAANLVTGIANAYQNRSPVIALSGQLETKYHRPTPPAHQYIDLPKLFSPITKKTFVVSAVAEIPQIIKEAINVAVTGRPGPVHVTLPVNIMEQEIIDQDFSADIDFELPNPAPPPESAIVKIAQLLQKANFPVVFFGQSALQAHPSFINYLCQAGIPVITSFLGKSSFPECHPLACGTISRHVKDALIDVLNKADLFLAVGYDYIEGIDADIFTQRPLLYIDTVPAQNDNLLFPISELVGDINQLTKELSSRLQQQTTTTLWDVQKITAVKNERYRQLTASQNFDSFPLNPFAVMRALQKVTTGEEIIVSDVGNHKQALGLGYDADQPLTTHFSNGLSSMGFSLPFAAGLRFSLPKNKTIISLNGDGGFLMNVQELETIKRYDLNLKIIVFVDNAFGMIKSNLLKKYQRVRHLDFNNPDFSLLAQSFGINYLAVAVKENLEEKLAALLNSSSTTLLTIPILYS